MQHPGMPEALMHQKAAELLHQMHLDDEWAGEYARGSDDVEMFLSHQQQPQHRGGGVRGRMAMGEPWAREMRMHEAYDDREREEMVAQYRREDFEGLDQAYESEAWAHELEQQERRRKEQGQQKDVDPWFDEFLQKENQLKENSLKQITARLTSIDDPKLQQSQFMSFVRDLDSGRASIEGNTVVRKGSGDWASEFTEARARDKGPLTAEEEADFLERMYLDPEFEPRDADLDWAGPSNYAIVRHSDEYTFETPAAENPYAAEADPLQRGLALFRDGRFSDAILAFEAAVLRDPHSAQGWHYLGKSHQEGDKDSQATAALLKAVQVAPTNLEAYVDLAVSQTNNMQKDRAMMALENWLQHNPKYSHLTPPPLEDLMPGGNVEAQLRAIYERQDVLIDCFVEAAQMSPNDVDPAVQVCLGLLYSLALEYDNAAQCFSAALTKLPDDYALWNKLGATLANGGRSEEALQAYFQALERKPLYVRARANLGISFLAMKLYPEAAKQFLSALVSRRRRGV